MKAPGIMFGKFAFSVFLSFSVAAGVEVSAQVQITSSQKMVSLREVIDNALLQNRQLQIERINPEIQKLTLRASYGLYDPRFQTRAHTESSVDTGGFDPANF